MDEKNKMQESQNLEAEMVQNEFDKLLDDYLHSSHRRKIQIITKAFDFAKAAHFGAKRKGGGPYIMHPLAVARIVCSEMGLGSTSICAALLHDVVEDTEYEDEDIRTLFGDKIAQIVRGLTKIIPGEITLGENTSLQVENFRKLFLTSSEDIRVVLIKIADRLHNMRTLGPMRPDKQYRNTGETLAVYVPLAHRLGLFKIKTELEDLCLKYEHPNDYLQIHEKLLETEAARNEIFERFAAPIRAELDNIAGIIEYRLDTRVKSAYSIWQKMQNQGIRFSEVYDLYAARIVFDPSPEADEIDCCWRIYTAVASQYRLKEHRIRDYISQPKPNLYQALHVTVMSPSGSWIEVQIRSKRMDEIAEKGVAAHWKYKGISIEEDSELGKMIPAIAEILQNPNPDKLSRFDEMKLSLSLSDISVFTPKGDMKSLPQGATVLDFAYLLHSDIGNRCIGAKVNHKLVPLSHKLTSADQVEILTSHSQEPQPEWFKFVITIKARNNIEESLKRIRQEESKKGEEKVLSAFKKAGLDSASARIDKLAIYFGFKNREDFFFSVEKGETTLPVNIKKIIKDRSGTWFTSMAQILGIGRTNESNPKIKEKQTNHPIQINKSQRYLLEENSGYQIATCCKPIPGDDALGFIQDNTIFVHKQSCNIAIKLKSSSADSIIATEWDIHNKASFEATIALTGIDSVGLLSQILRVTSNEFNFNILHLVMDAEDGVFNGKIKLQVHNVDDINKLCLRLSKINNLKSVSRVAD
jgi:GTP pyrophosphokinase